MLHNELSLFFSLSLFATHTQVSKSPPYKRIFALRSYMFCRANNMYRVYTIDVYSIDSIPPRFIFQGNNEQERSFRKGEHSYYIQVRGSERPKYDKNTVDDSTLGWT